MQNSFSAMFCSWNILKWNLTSSLIQTVGCLKSSLLLCFSSLGTSWLAVCFRASSDTAVTGSGPRGNAVQPATGLWCSGSACPREAAGETGDPKYWLHPPWVRASHSCVSRCLSWPDGAVRKQERGLCPLWCVAQLLRCRSCAGGLICSQRGLVGQLFCSCSSCNRAAAWRRLVGTAGTTFWSLLSFCSSWHALAGCWSTSSTFSVVYRFGLKVCSARLSSFANHKTGIHYQLQPT